MNENNYRFTDPFENNQDDLPFEGEEEEIFPSENDCIPPDFGKED
jgi:hypothetical protein